MADLSAKRVVDVVIASSALVMASPLLAMAAVAIRLDTKGPVIFRHARVGLGRRPIETLKLRTMVSGAERRGPSVTAAGDARVTRVGRWLRRTKIDELPQLWNVLRGDMSIVGPRPEVARYTDTYPPEWEDVFRVRPGLTDLASLTFRDEESLLATARDRELAYRSVILPMKIELALATIRNTSVRHDLAIVARTALSIVGGPDAQQQALLREAARRIAELEAR